LAIRDQNCFSPKLKTVVICIKLFMMKITYICIGLLSISIFSSCAGDDKKVEATSTTDGPKVIIDSTGLKGANGANNTMPLAANQPNVQTLVSNTGQPQTVTVPAQTTQVTTVPVQQQIQQQIQQQMQQQQAAKAQQVTVGQPQQVQASQQSPHPQFSAEEFKKMQDDAKKRGVSLNPAHGQPGHRCDIYVGQPLDSKPVAGLSQPAQAGNPTTASTPQVVTATPQPVKTEPGMNPPHGQPGHRCDIEVGKPLNSKPLPTTPAAAPATDSAKGGK
jgi:hypothetical protein